MNHDLEILYDIQEAYEIFIKNVEIARLNLRICDLSDFKTALDAVFQDEFLPVMYAQKEKSALCFEKYRQRLLKEYYDNLL